MRQRHRPRAVSYSPVTRRFRELIAAHAEAERRGIPVDEVAGERRELSEERRLTRGRLLAEATAAGMALAGAGMLSKTARAASTARVAIVGAGLAGIRCAHRLWTGGSRVASTVYEADTTHVGGRCWSLRGYFGDGLVAEHGGAFIKPRPDGDPEPRQDPRPEGGDRHRRRPSRRRGDLLVRRRAVHLRRGEFRLG